MSDEQMQFDRDQWPKEGTQISHLPADLKDLWDTFPEQAAVFIAEALVNNPPRIGVDLETCSIEIFLWEVGGDVIVLRTDLPTEIEFAAELYDTVTSEEQADEARRQIASLDRIAISTEAAKQSILQQIKTFDNLKPK